jgi:uncharacterized membrane protein YfcA
MIYAIVFLTAVVAGIIQNIAGFGASIVMMLVLPRFFDLVAAPALNQAISTGMTVLMAIRFFRYMEFKKVIPSFRWSSTWPRASAQSGSSRIWILV